MQMKAVSAEDGLNFNYYNKVGNGVIKMMKRIEDAIAERLIGTALKVGKSNVSGKISK